MAAEKFNSLTGYTIGIPPVEVIDSNGNVVTNVLVPTGNVAANAVFANNFFYANGQPFNPGGVPGGNTYDIQFNNNGNFGGSNAFTFDTTTNTLSLTGSFVTTGNINLGSVSNVTITGGSSGYVLTTDGTGNLSWGPGGGGPGTSGYSGYSGTSGYSGFSGLDGLSGYSGISGYSGAAGAPGTNDLVWATSGVYRTLVDYIDPGNVVQTIRSAQFANNLLQLTLASFTPTLSSTVGPSGTLNWDVPATSFNVNVTNPDDYPAEWISNVNSITVNTGSITALNTFTAGAQSNVPGPTVDWSQTFTTNGSSYIRPISSTITGGSANAYVDFDYWDGVSETLYTSGNTSFNVNWATPTISLTLSSLTGDTFLQEYTSTSYTLTVTGMTNPSNYSNSVTATGGSVDNPTGSGTFTFTTPINKDNTGSTRTVSDTTTFTRPSTVTGTLYTAQLSSTTSNPSATFSYPSLWVFTTSTFVVPTRSTYVLGTGFQPTVTVLSNQTHVFFGYVNNTNAVPVAFWFAVRSAAIQPTSFKTGASPSLLSDVAYTTGSVNLEPDTPPIGYVAEPYNLYGITLQPGSTYVSIS